MRVATARARRDIRHRRQLEEIAARNQLNASKRQVLPLADGACYFVQLGQDVSTQHADLVNHEHVAVLPSPPRLQKW